MSWSAFATSSTKQLNLLNDAIFPSWRRQAKPVPARLTKGALTEELLNDLAGDAHRHRSGIEGRRQPEIVQIAECGREAEAPGLDARVFLDVGCRFQQRTIEI